MKSSTSTNIKKREKPNDIFITPLQLAKKQIDMINYDINDLWLDPFKNDGSFYNQYPTNKKDWCEILEGKDFFEFVKDVIPSDKEYENIIEFKNKPIIKDNERYNEMCIKNQNIYINCMIKYLF